MSNVSRGAYFKSRTRKWAKALGWQVADLEIVHWLFTPTGRVPVKRDQLGSDLLLVSGRRVVFVQVKGGAAAVGAGTFPAAQLAFEQFRFPPWTDRWIVAWAPRAREPRIITCQSTQRRSADGEAQKPGTQQATGERQSSRATETKQARPAVANAPRHGKDPHQRPRQLLRGDRGDSREGQRAAR